MYFRKRQLKRLNDLKCIPQLESYHLKIKISRMHSLFPLLPFVSISFLFFRAHRLRSEDSKLLFCAKQEAVVADCSVFENESVCSLGQENQMKKNKNDSFLLRNKVHKSAYNCASEEKKNKNVNDVYRYVAINFPYY